MPRSARLWQLAGDYLVSLLLGAGLMLICGAITSGAGFLTTVRFFRAFAVLLTLIPLSGPIILCVVGLRRGRLGLSLGAVTLVVAAYVFAGIWMRNDVRAVELADQRNLAPFENRPGTLAIDGSHGHCDPLCLEILATSDFKVAIWNHGVRQWEVYQKIEGRACRDAAYRKSAMDFIEAGFAGLCASTSLQSDLADFVLVRFRDNRFNDDQTSGALPPTFSGFEMELLEQHGDQQRLLGRWVTGSVGPRIDWLTALGATPIRVEVGAFFTTYEFCSAALGLKLNGGQTPGRSDLSALLDEIESFIGDPASPSKTSRMFGILARRAAIEKPEILPARIARLLASDNEQARLAGVEALSALRGNGVEFAQLPVLRLLESHDPQVRQAGIAALESFQGKDRRFAQEPVEALLKSGDPQENVAGLKAIETIRGANLDFAQAHIARLLRSENPAVVEAALPALFSFDISDRGFAERHLFDLAFSPLLRDSKVAIADPLIGHLRAVPTMPDGLSLRAKAVLLREADLSRGQRKVLVAVLAHGGPDRRRAAIDTIFSLQGRPFAETIVAIGQDGWRDMAAGPDTDWSAEIAKLVDRADEVPNDLLKGYSDVFRFRLEFDRLESQLLAVVKQRLDAAESAEVRNEAEIKSLNRLIYIIPRSYAS